MPSLIDLRRRIRAVKSTQQITKAMKMIAASRLKRAQDRVINARPFAQRIRGVLNGLVTRVDPSTHPLLRVPAEGEGRPLLIVVSADRGLCGSFNSNIIKAAGQYIAELTTAPGLSLVGRKGREFFGRRGFEVVYDRINVFQKLSFSDAVALADVVIEEFTSGRASCVDIIFNEFKSVMTQRVVTERLLPIPRADLEDAAQSAASSDYIYEPVPAEIFRDLLPRYVQAQVYRALLESNAAFFASQMTAMDAATRNSTEMIDNLTLYMNKVRQAAITRE
ncbi:MAG: ATP synthase F1 subunit gamma, partial [Vicinamibacterales bacterium]|nr:ATP synthase F1 subunit gamma [Vicinamibacterales bacterium]